MVRIQPFAALRPLANKASCVACPPYDVVSAEEARRIAHDNPFSFMRVCRPEVDLPESVNPYDPVVYETGRGNLHRLIDQGVLVRDPQPRLYLYRQVLAHRSQIGVVCCCHVDDYLHDVIRKHEKTRPDKEDDRTRHILSLNAHAGPVFLTYRDASAMADLVARDTNERPIVHFNAPDGVTHTAWVVPDPRAYVELFASVPVAYVADGHHRSASAARAAMERRAANPRHTGAEEYNWFLAVIFPASQLHVLPYNRLVADLRGQTAAQVLMRLESLGTLTTTQNPSPDRPGVFCFYLQGAWRRLALHDRLIDHADPIRSLDVSLLQQHVLEPVLGIGDPRTDKRIDFVGGIRGTDELQRRVDQGQAALAVSMYPTSIDQLLAVADAGQIMPPKSTWFEPKLRSGLFVHLMD